ncbi:glycosyltransferase family 2 protein [Streptomyces sp. ISL-94]|uniref:glycosyltransferase family 2 protein n=1 Tax=Streptomyces sp. ISL-94 TaxID=2819190 RepID=UPI001BEC74E6|nr:glycosyltransferase [Streptomyces sp. ISL-94]MBT2478875.1 glycosyltransferase [Streptomyces sp. ISL-94]
MTDPRTTVVVITRNRREQVLCTLDRLARLPERPPVIVTDNASDDGTAEAITRLHPQVTVLRTGRNLGAVGRNLGVRRARTPYVAFSDDDSWWEPGALGTAERLLDSHPRLGLLAARIAVGPGGVPDPLNAMLAGSPLGRTADLPGPQVLGFLACAAVVRRQAYLDAGGYHPVLFFGGEETLLAYDMAASGWGVCHSPDVVAVHRPTGVRAGRPAVQLRNAALTAWMRRPPAVALRHSLVLAAAAGRDPQARRELRELLARLPAALRCRRPLPPALEAAARRLD